MSTKQVAGLLGVSVSKLTREVWLGRIQAPPKSPAGDHLWGRTDVERACWMLLHRDLDVVLAERLQKRT
jgi:DNA-binding transcriptional MerR regulator